MPPSAIEACLIASSQIKSACVIGISVKDTDFPAAIAVRADGCNTSEEEVFNKVAGNFTIIIMRELEL